MDMEFVTPPENQGQIVEVSYAWDDTSDYIVERTLDHSDGSEIIRYYADPEDGPAFEPWNQAPKLGALIREEKK